MLQLRKILKGGIGVHGVNYLQQGFPTDLWLPLISQEPTQNFSVGQFIYHQETEASCFYYLKDGKVKSFIQSEDGNERVLHTYGQGEIFGEVSFFDELPRVSSAVAVADSKVVSIDKKLVTEQFGKEPQLALSMIKYLARTVRLLSEQVDDMAFRPAPQRVARYLLQHRNGNNLVIVTQEEIATSVSVSRITVSRILGRFTEQGWLETQYGGILLKNLSELERFFSS